MGNKASNEKILTLSGKRVNCTPLSKLEHKYIPTDPDLNCDDETNLNREIFSIHNENSKIVNFYSKNNENLLLKNST